MAEAHAVPLTLFLPDVPVNQRLKLLAFGALLLGPLCWDWIKLRLDPRDLAAHAATIGPRSVVPDENGGRKLDGRVSAIRAGESFGWTSIFCVEAGATMISRTSLVDAQGRDALPPNDRWFPPGTRCGPLDIFFDVPAHLPPGRYTLKRQVVLFPPGGSPTGRRMEVPDIPIEIVAP